MGPGSRSLGSLVRDDVNFVPEADFIFQTANDSLVGGPSFRDGALAPDPESRDSGFDASHRPRNDGLRLRIPAARCARVVHEPFAL